MAKCANCDEPFDPTSAASQYQDLMEDEDDDPGYDEVLCLDCALPAEVSGLVAQGRAIDMANGEADYDDDFVTKHL